MTTEGMLDSIAINSIVNQNKEDIRDKFNYALGLVLKTIHRRVKGYWLKENSNFTLTASSHTANLASNSYFPNILEPKFFWTTEGVIDFKTEKWFRRVYPAPTETGTPTLAIWITDNTFRFYPTPTANTTIYLSYYYTPSYTRIEGFPSRFHGVIEYGVLSMFEDNPTKENSFTRGKYTMLYERELQDMAETSVPFDEWEPEVDFNPVQGDINAVTDNLRRT